MERIQKTEDMFELIELSKAPNTEVRLKAIQQMCPCRVDGDVPEFWERLFEMTKDEDSRIRFQVMHNMCDGSSRKYENRIMECIEDLRTDKDAHVRTWANKVHFNYQKHEKWNIM